MEVVEMTTKLKLVLAVVLALGLVLTGSAVMADEDGVPSFKKDKDKDTKEFITKVFKAIVKEARLKTKNHRDIKYEYVNDKDKDNRKELHITGVVDGAAITKNVKVIITIKLDTTNKEGWEVLNIDYKDTFKLPTGPNTTKIQGLIKKFNGE